MPYEWDPTYIVRTSADGAKPILIAQAGNPAQIQASIDLSRKRYSDQKAKATALIAPYVAESPFGSPCNGAYCLHCIDAESSMKRHGLFPSQRGSNFVVACDPEHTNVVDDCVECFTRPRDGALVLRVHLAYPESLSCASESDRNARLATFSAFLTKSLNETTTAYLFDRSHDGNYTKGGFKLNVARVALTVESVFDQVPSPEQFNLNHAKSSVYVSQVTLTHRITDEALFQHLCPPEKRGVSLEEAERMAADASEADRMALTILTRVYTLVQCQGWAKGRLFEHCSTTPVYGNDPQAAPLLRQRFYPDYHAQITQFCFQHIVSQAVLRLAADYVEKYPRCCLPLTCRLPFGDDVPVLTAAQVCVLEGLGCRCGLAAGEPRSHTQWRRACGWAAKRHVGLLRLFEDLGIPLVNAAGRPLRAGSARFTPTLNRNFYCVVISNKPMRDYMCLVNARCVVCMLLKRHAGLNAEAHVFEAWVNYWSAMHLSHQWARKIMVDGIIFCHMKRGFARIQGDLRTCVVEGRVSTYDAKRSCVVVVFPSLNRRRMPVPWAADAAPPTEGTRMLFSARTEKVGFVTLRYMQDGLQSCFTWRRFYVPDLRRAAS